MAGIVFCRYALFVLTNWRRGYLVTGWFWFVVTLSVIDWSKSATCPWPIVIRICLRLDCLF